MCPRHYIRNQRNKGQEKEKVPLSGWTHSLIRKTDMKRDNYSTKQLALG